MTSSGSASIEDILSVLNDAKSKAKRPRATNSDSDSIDTGKLLRVFKRVKLDQRSASPAAKPSGMCHHSDQGVCVVNGNVTIRVHDSS